LKNKKFISIFLVLVLSIQLLPVKQMISWLVSNQVTEELAHGTDSGKSNPGFDEINKHLPVKQDLSLAGISTVSSGSIRHDAEALISRHADDIPTPPPNCQFTSRYL